MFCKKCGSLLMPSDGKMKCRCGYSEESGKLKDKSVKKTKIEVIDKEQQDGAYPVINAECEKCGSKKAYFWTKQTRSSDEPETKFFKCVKCGHIWREY